MIDIRIGDCLQVMPTLSENSVDSIITDPPYGLDFMGKEWDHGVPGVEFWQAALRVAKPGATLLCFGGDRTHHRLMVAIEDAGWEIRTCMYWVFGSGFPKSLDISKALDKEAGITRPILSEKVNRASFDENGEGGGGFQRGTIQVTAPATDSAKIWSGWGTALKPAAEIIVVAMKPLEGTYAENAQKWGVAGLNIDGSRIPTDEVLQVGSNKHEGGAVNFGMKDDKETQAQSPLGRWPANLLLDEESARLLDEASRFFYTAKASHSERNAGLEDCETKRDADRVRDDGVGGDNPRNRSNTPKQNFHPTVKPVDLMRYLCKLTRTPTGGVVLDPFMGSGTTGIACVLEHRDFIGIELNAEYVEIARKRIADMEGPLFSS